MKSLRNYILGRGRWYVAIRDNNYLDGQPSYCITNGIEFVGNWWLSSPMKQARRQARKMNRHEGNGMRTMREIQKDRLELERQLQELDREIASRG